MVKRNINRKQNGFTLLELLISMTVFSIVVIAFLGLFVSTFKEQKKSLNTIHLVNNGSYVMEYMTRALRMAKKDITGACVGTAKYNYDNPENDTAAIQFLVFNKEANDFVCQKFYKDGNTLKARVGISGAGEAMLPADIIVDNLNFMIIGDGQGDEVQPRVTLVLQIKTTGANSQTMSLQTTVSQRELDVNY